MRAKWETAAKRGESTRDDWRTPREVADLVHELFGGEFHLDPCSGAGSILHARHRYNERYDGLAHPWVGTCYANPPFSKLRKFAAKAAHEYRIGNAEAIVLLMASRTDTRAWHESIATAAAVCFWRGRVKFIGAPDPCPFPLAFSYWGPRVAKFERVFGRAGMVVRLPADPLR